MTLYTTFPPISSMQAAGVKECQYIEGDKVTPEAMCGKPVKIGSVYCLAHHARCFVPLRPRPPGRVVE